MSLPEKRSGHIGVRYQNHLIVWGGHNSQSFMDHRELWFYNMKTAKWLRREAAGDLPPSSSGSSATLIDTCLYLFAGFSFYGSTNVIFMLDLPTLKWTKLDVKSKEPSPRDKLGCWVRDTSIIFFGGYGTNPTEENIRSGIFVHDNLSNFSRGGWNNDLLSFDTEKQIWEALPLTDTTPSPRAAHACATMSKNIGYLFGGRHLGNRLNDLYSINLESFLWTKIQPFGLSPQGRTWHSLTPVDNQHLLIFGGLNTLTETLADAWVYSATKNAWTELLYERKEVKRWHSACKGLYPGQVVVFGGCCSVERMHLDGMHVNELRIFQVTPPPLRNIAVNAVVKFGRKCGSLTDLPRELLTDVMEMMSGG